MDESGSQRQTIKLATAIRSYLSISNLASELLLQLDVAELDHRRTTVRTGVREVATVELLEQRAQFLTTKRVVRLDGVTADRRRDLVLAEPSSVDLFAGLAKLVHDVAKYLQQVLQAEVRWYGVNKECLVAELTNADTEFVERLEIATEEISIVRVEFKRLRQQQLL